MPGYVKQCTRKNCGVTINCIGPDRARTGPEMTDYFTSTTN